MFTSALGQDRAGGGDLALDWLGTQVFGISQTPQVLLDNQVYELGGELVVHWDAVAELFPTGVLDEMFTAYRDLLRRLAWGWWDLPSPPADVPRVDGALEAGPLHGPLLAQAAARPGRTGGGERGWRPDLGDAARPRRHRRAPAAGDRPRPRGAGGDLAAPGTGQGRGALGVLLADAPFHALDPEASSGAPRPPADRRPVPHRAVRGPRRGMGGRGVDRRAGRAGGRPRAVPPAIRRPRGPGLPDGHGRPGRRAGRGGRLAPGRAHHLRRRDWALRGRPDDRVLGVSPRTWTCRSTTLGVLGARRCPGLPEPDAPTTRGGGRSWCARTG
ncbi:hypothetical protein HCB39_28755 [Salinispora arenicola]|nr:hypothetical protein [Salinispora arenicola]NIL64934.1 hypothetical protein [Salinispora arenicola]